MMQPMANRGRRHEPKIARGLPRFCGCARAPYGRTYHVSTRRSRRARRQEETMFAAMKFRIILWGLAQLMIFARWRHPAFRARLKERNIVAQFKARDEEIGRWYAIRDGEISSGAGLRADADVTLAFK